MAKITIGAHSVLYNSNQHLPAYARVYCNQQFVNGDDQSVLQGEVESGNYVKQVAVTNAAGVATIAAFSGANQIDSSVDSNGVTISTYALTLHDANGTLLHILYPNVKIPLTPTTTGWDDIVAYTQLPSQPMRYDYYTKPEIDRILLGYQNTALKASLVQLGVTKLSVTPADLNNPIAVGDLDTRLPVNITTYGDELFEAVAAIGATETVLQITRPVAVDADLVVPNNITLDVQGTGLIVVDGGMTLTIGSMRNPGSRKIFSGAGTVKFAKGAVEHIDVSWFVGIDDLVSVTTAVNTILQSCLTNNGGTVYFPEGVWLTDGNHIISSGTHIRGAGVDTSSPVGSGGTCIRAKGDAASVFYVGEDIFNTSFTDIAIDGDDNNITGILCEGEYPNSSGTLRCTNVGFYKCTQGFYIHDTPSAQQWQMAFVEFDHCTFVLNTHSGYRCDTINTRTTFISTDFGVQNDAWGLYLQNSGALAMFNCEFAGLSGSAACSGGIPGASMAEGCVYIGGAHAPLSFHNCPDEGFRYRIYNNAGDIESVIDLFGCQVQSIMFLNETCTLNLFGGSYPAKSLMDSASSASRVQAYGIGVLDADVCGNVVASRVLTNLVGSTVVTTEMSPLTDQMIFRQPAQFLSPAQYDGAPNTPVARFGHYTGVTEDKILARFGRTDINGVFDFYYDLKRIYATGRLSWEGNQALPNRGFDFNAEIRAHQFSMSLVTALATTGTVALDASLSNRYSLTPTGDMTINASSLVAGKNYYLVILTSGTTSRTITFGTAFKSTGTLATGTTSGKYFVVEFHSDGTNLIELKRTTAL